MKRIAIYVYHNKKGTIEDYALFYINSLLEVTDELIVVINGIIDEFELKKLENKRIKLIQRENIGYDFWGYRKGFLSIGSEKLKQFDELVFTNNSCYGPIFPFSELFKVMREKDADFWGISKHIKSDKKVMKFNPKTKIKEHLQTYFLAIRNKMFTSPEFREYFENLKKIKNKKEAIAFLEINFTEYFKKFNYKYDTFIDDSILSFGVENYHQYLPSICIEKYRCPLVKKTSFGYRYDLAQKESLGQESEYALDYIKDKTNYNQELIIKDILKNYPMDEIQKFLHLNFILSNSKRENFSPYKIAFLYKDEKLIEPYMEFIKGHFDIYKIKDSALFFKQLKELSKKYSYILVFNPNTDNLREIEKQSYIKHLISCSIENRIYLSNVINTFIKNPQIGVLTPIPFIYSGFRMSENTVKEDDVENFISRINYDLKYNLDYIKTIPSCFFIRNELLSQIEYRTDIEAEDVLSKGMIFEILSQKYGFLTGKISTVDAIRHYFDNLQYMVLNTNEFLSDMAFKVKKMQKRF